MNKHEIMLAGSGGQGMILASIILAQAATLANKNVAQSQSYGPEARGGMCKAELIISDSHISFPRVINPTFILALTQPSLDNYTKGIPADCIVMADESLVIPKWLSEQQVISIPVLDTARIKIGKLFTANIVAVGAINKVLNIADEDSLRNAVMMHIPKKTEEINMKALKAGELLLDKYQSRSLADSLLIA